MQFNTSLNLVGHAKTAFNSVKDSGTELLHQIHDTLPGKKAPTITVPRDPMANDPQDESLKEIVCKTLNNQWHSIKGLLKTTARETHVNRMQPQVAHDLPSPQIRPPLPPKPTVPSKPAIPPKPLVKIKEFIDLTSQIRTTGSRHWVNSYRSLKANQAFNMELKQIWKDLSKLPKIAENRTSANKLLQSFLTTFSHEWGLKGKVKIGDEEVNLESHNQTYMHANLSDSVSRYFSNKDPEELAAHGLNAEDVRDIQKCLDKSVGYSTYDPSEIDKAFGDYKQGELVTLSAIWGDEKASHAVEVTIFKNQGKTYLVYTNRGEKKRGETLNESDAKMKIFEMDGDLTLEQLQLLTDQSMKQDNFRARLKEKLRKQPNETLTPAEIKQARMEFFDGTGAESMQTLFGLKQIGIVEKTEQKVGNCSWANAKGGFHACLLLKMMTRAQQQDPRLSSSEALQEAVGPSTALFKDWELDHRLNEMEFLLSLAPAVSKGEVDMSVDEYHAMVLKLSEKIAVQGKFDRYQDTGAFPESVRQRINDIEQKLQNFLRQDEHVIPLTSIARQGRPELQGVKPGTFLIWNWSMGRRVTYIDKEGVEKTKDIPENCKNVKDLLTWMPELRYPIMQISKRKGSTFGKKDSEVFDELKSKKQAFDTAKTAEKHLLSQTAGSYAIYPHESQAGKYCVRFKLEDGKLSELKILLPSNGKKLFALDNFLYEQKVRPIMEELDKIAKPREKQSLEEISNSLKEAMKTNLNAKIVLSETVGGTTFYHIYFADKDSHMRSVTVARESNRRLSIASDDFKVGETMVDTMDEILNSAEDLHDKGVPPLNINFDVKSFGAQLDEKAKECPNNPHGELKTADPSTVFVKSSPQKQGDYTVYFKNKNNSTDEFFYITYGKGTLLLNGHTFPFQCSSFNELIQAVRENPLNFGI